MSVLVTGGAGFIGSHTVEALIRKGYEVKVLDNLKTGKIVNLKNILDKIKLIKGDIRDENVLSIAIKNSEYIIHLAAIVSVDEAINNPLEAFEVNAFATLKLLELARILEVEKIVYASSTAVYGEPISFPINENHPTNPKNPYGASKLAGESLMTSFGETYGIETISLRYFNVYGPRMQAGPYAGVISKFIEAARRNKPLLIYGDGNQTRDFIHVHDVVKANILALESKEKGVYNIGTGVETRIIELAKLIIELTKSKSVIKYTKPRSGDIYRSVADIRKAKNKLGWKPQITLREGLTKLIQDKY